jgi:hypothetical protein
MPSDDTAERLATPAPPEEQQLRVGAADDGYERAADAAADRVMDRLRENGAGGGVAVVGERPAVARRSDAIGAEGGLADTDTSQRIEQARTRGGDSLPTGIRRSMESAFGTSLADVRLHTGGEAEELNARVGARAFTVGSDIFLGAGTPAASTEAGQHLLAHEIAHTRQQGPGAHRQTIRRDLTTWTPGAVKDKTKTPEEQKHGEKVEHVGMAGEWMEDIKGAGEGVGQFNEANEYSSVAEEKHLSIAHGGKWGNETVENRMVEAGAAFSTFGIVVDALSAVKIFMDKDTDRTKRAGAVLGVLGSTTAGASSIAGATQKAQGGEAASDATKAAASVLAEIAGVMGTIKAGYELVCQIVELVKEGGNLDDGDKASKTVSVLRAALDTGKNIALTVLAIEQHIGTVTGAMLQAAPGIGIAMGVLDLIIQGINIGYAYVAYSEMRTDKRAAKEALLGRKAAKTRWGGNASAVEDANAAFAELDRLSKVPMPSDEKDLAAHKKSVADATDKADKAKEYMLVRNLQEIAGKRIKRAVLNIATTLPGIAGDIALLSGAGAAVGAGLKVAGGGAKVIAAGVRAGKQAYHDYKGDDKSATKKAERYEAMITEMIGGVLAANAMPDLVPAKSGQPAQPGLAKAGKQLQAAQRVEASGLAVTTMKKYHVDATAPDTEKDAKGQELYGKWMEALKKR